MAVVCGRILTTNAILRIVAMALAIVAILLARFGGSRNNYMLDHLVGDPMWLTIIASGGYVIILAGIIGTYFRGQGVPLFMEYFYICVGVAVFIAAGGTLINHYSHCGGYCNDYNKGMALACCMLAAGATMAIDLGLMVFNCRR